MLSALGIVLAWFVVDAVAGVVLRNLQASWDRKVTDAALAQGEDGTPHQVVKTTWIDYGRALPWQKTVGTGWNADAVVDYDLPGAYHTRYETNARGYRGDVVPYKHPDDTFRVLIIGDSFVEAIQVAYPDTYMARLQEHLQAMTTRKVEVIGVGNSGWGTIQEYLYYHLEGHRYHPDLVIGAFIINDPGDNYPEAYYPTDCSRLNLIYHVIPNQSITSEPRPADQLPADCGGQLRSGTPDAAFDKPDRLTESMHTIAAILPLGSNVARLLRWREQTQLNDIVRLAGPCTHNCISQIEMCSKIPTARFNGAWQRTYDALSIWQHEVQANGSRFALLTVPDGFDQCPSDAGYSPDAYHTRIQALRRFVIDNGGISLDPTGYVQTYMKRNQTTWADMHTAPADYHYSALAHHLIGDYLAQALSHLLQK